jgi:hypothetical protein
MLMPIHGRNLPHSGARAQPCESSLKSIHWIDPVAVMTSTVWREAWS